MLKSMLWFSSLANVGSGVVLIITFLNMSSRVPTVVPAIGAALLIQGAYTIVLISGQLDAWGDGGYKALLGAECLFLAAGIGLLAVGIANNVKSPKDIEMAPVIAGFIMALQATVALVYLLSGRKVRAH